PFGRRSAKKSHEHTLSTVTGSCLLELDRECFSSFRPETIKTRPDFKPLLMKPPGSSRSVARLLSKLTCFSATPDKPHSSKSPALWPLSSTRLQAPFDETARFLTECGATAL